MASRVCKFSGSLLSHNGAVNPAGEPDPICRGRPRAHRPGRAASLPLPLPLSFSFSTSRSLFLPLLVSSLLAPGGRFPLLFSDGLVWSPPPASQALSAPDIVVFQELLDLPQIPVRWGEGERVQGLCRTLAETPPVSVCTSGSLQQNTRATCAS